MEKEPWTRHMLYFPLVPRSLALNTFPVGHSLIVFHLDMWCECEVTNSLIYQLFVSCFLMWTVSHDTFFFLSFFFFLFFSTWILDNYVRVNTNAPDLLHTSVHILVNLCILGVYSKHNPLYYTNVKEYGNCVIWNHLSLTLNLNKW